MSEAVVVGDGPAGSAAAGKHNLRGMPRPQAPTEAFKIHIRDTLGAGRYPLRHATT